VRDLFKVHGRVTVRVLCADGSPRRQPPGPVRRLLGLPGKVIEQVRHNVITRQGEAIIADALLGTPRQKRVNSVSGYIQVGTGWTGQRERETYRCVRPVGAPRIIDHWWPHLKAKFGETGDATVVYRATFPSGALVATGVNEACLLNGDGGSARCLAYARIAPPVDVMAGDLLQILWEVTIVGT